MTTAQPATLEAARHVHARELAQRVAALPRDQQAGAVMLWLDVATKIRGAVRDGTRRVKERSRIAKSRGGTSHADGFDTCAAVAVAAVLRASKRGHESELTEREVDCARRALEEVADNISNAPSDTPPGVLALGALWMTAASSIANYMNVRLAGIVQGGILGTGKVDAPFWIAVLALTELGFSNAEIHRITASAEPGDHQDRAQIRRMTRAIRRP